MSALPPPSPAEQIHFLQQVRRLLSDGGFVASYKFALLHALADLAVIKGDNSGAELRLTTHEIAEQVIELYWRQTRPFPTPQGEPQVLQQNTGRQAKIIVDIEAVQHRHGGSLMRLRQNRVEWQRLVREVDRVVRQMPLWKLQTVGQERLDFLYENKDHGTFVTLRAGVAYCLRTFYDLVADLVRGAWLRYVRRYNAPLLGVASDLGTFLFGSERSGLGAYYPILVELQDGCCFYCRRALRAAGEVDHFIPWSRYPVDLGHNFVLADAACNRDKSDHLAAEPHLERWLVRNEQHRNDLAVRFNRLGVSHDASTSGKIAEWAYGQAYQMDGQVWVGGRLLAPLSEQWEALFRAHDFPHL